LDENARKLEKMDDRQRQIEMLNVKMGAMLEKHDNMINSQDVRISKLEERKIILFDKTLWIVIAAIVGGLITSLIEFFLK
jgi:hypothetical protein